MNVVVLTATINPKPGIGATKRIDSRDRENDYLLAFDFYLNQLDKGINYLIFGENSLSDLSKLKEMVKRRKFENKVEFISYNGMTHNPAFGKGYGEFKLVDYIMDNSIIINSLTNESTIWKITGRYIIVNILKLNETKPADFDIYCNYKIHPNNWVDMYLMAWKKKSYHKYLKGIYNEFCETITNEAPEFVFRRYLEETNAKVEPRFKLVPKVEAISGCNNKSTMELTGHLKYWIRVIMHKLLPELWL